MAGPGLTRRAAPRQPGRPVVRRVLASVRPLRTFDRRDVEGDQSVPTDLFDEAVKGLEAGRIDGRPGYGHVGDHQEVPAVSFISTGIVAELRREFHLGADVCDPVAGRRSIPRFAVIPHTRKVVRIKDSVRCLS